MRTRIITGLVILSVAACGPTPSRGDGDDDTPAPDAAVTPPPPDDPGPGCQAIDVLFVIDNSGSMSQEQATLGANFASFLRVTCMRYLRRKLDGGRDEPSRATRSAVVHSLGRRASS